jgi:CheY-like chemotaxis protein/HPt (histidine-containing phosphotransfer) domain-containing protein
LASISSIADDSGKITNFVGIKEDITERKEWEKTLVQARDVAEELAKAKASFLANMSHEIRTPLNGILGMLEMLLDSDLEADQQQSVEVALSSADALLSILNDILDISKIEAGHLELEEIAFDLEATVSGTARVLALSAQKRDNELHIDIQQGVPTTVVGDPGRLRQVITNLLGNAIKFTQNGEITVALSNDDTRNGTSLIRFDVVDTGVGIPEEKLNTIFAEFAQADASVTRTHGGTGLGLTISRKIIEKMGGELHVESTVDMGSRFWFAIPMHATEAEIETQRKQPVPMGLDGKRLLVVDDNETARRIVKQTLEPQGARVDEADAVDSAFSILLAAADVGALHDAVVIDSMMPERDGFDLAKEVQHHPALAGMRLMMLSSAADVEGRKKARDHGIKGYLTKPVSRADLVEAVQALLRLRGQGEGPERRLVTVDSLVNDRPTATILLAEDNETNQRVAVAMLTKRGHQVDLVENGKAAVDSVKLKRYDIVLMDIQMPEMDGLEATREIRKTHEHADLPIVALTAHAFAEERERCEAAGMNGFLTKPFKPHELYDVVERWLRSAETDNAKGTPAGTDRDTNDNGSAPVNLNEFRATMSEAGVEEIVPITLATFLDEAPTKRKTLTDAVVARDGSAISKAAHALKSSSGAIRADTLAGILQQLEDAGKNGNVRKAAGLLENAMSEFDLVEGYLRNRTSGE